MDIKQTTIKEIVDSEREMVLRAGERYGEFFANANSFADLFGSFIKSVDKDRFVFAMFLSQARKHHMLALLSVVRLHQIQAQMDLRQVLEAGACAAYAIANTDPKDFADVDEYGILNPSQELTTKRYKWLEANFGTASQAIKNMKGLINESTAHANIVHTHNNFRFDKGEGIFETPFFDIEDEHHVKTYLWQCANIAMGLMDVFYGVATKYGGVKFIDDFADRLKEYEKQNLKLKEEMMASERGKEAQALAERRK